MADQAAEQRAALEHLIGQRIDAAAAQRGWDLGFQAAQAAQAAAPAATDTGIAYEFATGWDPVSGTTVTYFLFDVSTLDGPDTMS